MGKRGSPRSACGGELGPITEKDHGYQGGGAGGRLDPKSENNPRARHDGPGTDVKAGAVRIPLSLSGYRSPPFTRGYEVQPPAPR
ncbi:hypothetical protein SKAU_G00304200 [Synaphobranchus kaupii]|uniref:Uncharacterized protein n=1 Tax=Synaphobranchus kaupii TaxID=118154 RepID=A0A9Q1IML7_SYNKA|nr:hypothetical protein SKAU_G00304200 [Synaphobranchus kaupii]